MYNCCFISAPFIFISRTYHLYSHSNFFYSLPCRLHWIVAGADADAVVAVVSVALAIACCSISNVFVGFALFVSLIVDFTHIGEWKNGVINNFLTQFYVLISIVVCLGKCI